MKFRSISYNRFSEIQSAIGISGKVLSDRLKDLEHQGVVKREVIPETPVIIEYSLTEKGRSLEPVLREIESMVSALGETGTRAIINPKHNFLWIKK